MIRVHESQAAAVEHEANVDEEDAVAGAAVQEFLFEQLADAPLIGAVIDFVILGHVLIELDFISARVGLDFAVDSSKTWMPALDSPAVCLMPSRNILTKRLVSTSSSHQKPRPPIPFNSSELLSTMTETRPPGTLIRFVRVGMPFVAGTLGFVR
jgi:hypothetical protein